MRKNHFIIETYSNNIFEGFTQDENWNGWSCPYFTFDEAQKIVDVHKQAGQKAWYDKSSDEFRFEVTGEDESYSPVELEGKKLYPIGHSSWIWEEIK